MQSCTTALGFLRKTASLNSELVFITQDGQLKVIHNDLVDENYRYTYNQQYLYAPEKLLNFNQLDHEPNLIKEAVFSMGMTVLQAALLIESINCYDHQRHLFLEVNLELMLQDLEGVYSNEFGNMLRLMLKVEPKERPTLAEIEKLLDGYWNCAEEGEGEDVTLGMSRRCLNASEEKGIIKNLVTINSHQKESVIRETSKPSSVSSNSKGISGNVNQGISGNVNQISQSIECSVPSRPAPSSHADKENQSLYTDPKLLQMIRQDLQDINKLKQSTLKETIKYSFLYPESDSIFKSVQDVKLVRQSVQVEQEGRKMQPLEESDGN